MLFVDIETFSSVDLKKAGVYAYAESPDFEILMAGWTVDRVNYHIAVGEDQIMEIPHLWDDDPKVAHNAPFERVCFSTLNGGDLLPPEQWHDTMALAAEHGLPRSLDALARALGAEPKDSAGTLLINYFCKPYRGKRRSPQSAPDKWEAFKRYCIQDVRSLVEVWEKLPDWPTKTEQKLFFVDQHINDRGILVDTKLARQAIVAADENERAHIAEIRKLTGIDNPRSVQQLSAWLSETGAPLPDMRADTVSRALSGSLSAPQQRVLSLRQELALTTGKKYGAALTAVSQDDRLRGMFWFYGAHTGRWSGRRVQLQNLTRASVDNVQASILDLMMGNGADSQTLKGLIRPLFMINGCVADYAQIEARVVAWLAGEQWALDAFEEGRDIYTETADRMGGLTRAQGKIAVLALGYNGGINSLRVMGAKGSDEQLKKMVYQWRNANPRIVRLWKRLGEALREGGRAGRIRVIREGRDVSLILPSGRPLVYHDMRWEHYRIKDEHTGEIIKKEGWRFADARGYRVGTYGGRLTENVTQAVARDILGEALIRLEEAGYPVVGHVHDEILVESPDIEKVIDLMCVSPRWAKGLPIGAEGKVVDRYRKL